MATLYLGADMLAVQLQPQTRRFEDLIRVAQVVLLFLIGMAACVGVGASVGGFVLASGRARLVFAATIALTLVGLGCAVAAFL